MSNSWKDYLQDFRDNLPTGVTYREDIARYFFNDKRFILPNDVLRYKNYLEKLGFISAVITAIIQPALGPLEDGDAIASALSADIDQTSNYASTGGTITTVDVAITVNGVTALATDVVEFSDIVSVVVTVIDSEANERVYNAGSQTVAGIAPTNDVVPSIAGGTGLGDTLTVTAGTWSGAPAPTLAYQWLRDGVEIEGETGTTYEITLADSGTLIAVRETATNAEGSVFEVSNDLAIPAVPDAFTASDWDVANNGSMVSVNIITLPNDGGSPITDLEYRVNAGAVVLLGETTTGSYPIAADEGDDIQVRAVNAVGAGDWSNVQTVAAPPSATGGTETVIAQSGTFYRVHTFLSSGTLTITAAGHFAALLVAGGGPGGGGGDFGAGGGGSAGDVLLTSVTLPVGTHVITVGEGGICISQSSATKGGNSAAFNLTALGGGVGGSRQLVPNDGGGGADAGNATGAAHPSGFNGGNGTVGSGPGNRSAGGGRGSAGDGSNASDGLGGNGGPGTSSDITGKATDYGRGGAGGSRNTGGAPNGASGSSGANVPGGPGVNPGDGGGGGDRAGLGGPGANGIVIVRYEITEEEFNEAA